MTSDSMRLVEALIAAGSKDKVQKLGDEVPRGPVVTVSRSYGSGGLEVARRLAERLQVKCFDREILDSVAEDSHVDRYLMEQLDERFKGNMNSWVYSILTGKSVFPPNYRRHLVNVLLAIAQKGGVIVGRGGHLVLQDKAEVLRVRVVASPETRIARVEKRDNLSRDAAMKRMHEVDQERDTFIRALYKVNGAEPHDFDLTVNTDRYSIDEATLLVVDALERRGIAVPKGARA